jgi:hypothetical protein
MIVFSAPYAMQESGLMQSPTDIKIIFALKALSTKMRDEMDCSYQDNSIFAPNSDQGPTTPKRLVSHSIL